MLSHSVAPKSATNHDILGWTDQDFDLVAAKLKGDFPNKSYSIFHSLHFTPAQVEEAAEAVLPQHKHRAIDDYVSIRKPMFSAFERLNSGNANRPKLAIAPGTTTSNGVIKWSPQEWETVILAIHRNLPNAFAERLKNLHVGDVREAVNLLDIDRRRHFKQIVSFKEQALKIWDSLPEHIRNPEPSIVDFPSGPIMVPAVLPTKESTPIAEAMQKAFKTAEADEGHEKRKIHVRTTDEEWLKVAREMHRQSPDSNYFRSGFHKIDLQAVRDAQRVLPFERRRTLSHSGGLQAPLVKAFKALTDEMHKEKETKVAAQGSNIAPQPEQENLTPGQKRVAKALAAKRLKMLSQSKEERSKLAKKSWETRRRKQQGNIKIVQNEAKGTVLNTEQEALQPDTKPMLSVAPIAVTEALPVAAEAVSKTLPVSEDFVTRMASAASPLVNFFLDELTKRLAPTLSQELINHVTPVFNGMMADVKKALATSKQAPTAGPISAPAIPPQLAAAPAQKTLEAPVIKPEAPPAAPSKAIQEVQKRLSKAELEQYLGKPAEKVKKPKIALVMPPGSQREYMRNGFPEYEFVFIDHGEGIKEAAQSCVLFVAMEAYVTMTVRQKIKAHVSQDMLKYVDGGVSAIKRYLHIWKAENKK